MPHGQRRGETIAHLLHLNGSLADCWFLVDEVGLLPLSTLGAMSKWQRLGAKFMFFGDFEGQFEPLRDRWDMDLRNGDNDLMHQLCNGCRVQLQTYRRGTDPAALCLVLQPVRATGRAHIGQPQPRALSRRM